MKDIIGYLEKVDLHELSLFGLDAKIDTGADSSALHCDNIEDHGETVTFTLLDHIHPAYNDKSFTLPVAKRVKVKSSNGQTHQRIFIQTTISLGEIKSDTLISLAGRENLKYPMLIGKRFLRNHFLVDVSFKYLKGE